MVSEFSVFGSCTCRDVFYSQINKDYKKFFHLGKTGIRITFVSLMQPPVEFTANSIKIYPENKENKNFSKWIEEDLNKVFLKDLAESDIEYILIDTYYDTNFGIIDIGDDTYITNNVSLSETEFYKNLKYKEELKIQNDTEKYYDIWTESCDSFFKFMRKNCPDIKIILNPTRHVDKILMDDGSVMTSEAYKLVCRRYNPYRDLLDLYICENYDIDVLYFDDNTLANENHYWGISSLHFEDSYYDSVTGQLNNIIKRDSILEDKKSIKEKFKKQNRDILLFKIYKNKRSLKLKWKLNKQHKELLNLNNEINDELEKLNENEEIKQSEYDFLKKLNNEILKQITKIKS